MCMLMFIPTYGIVLLIRIFAVITKYTVLDEQRREAKEGKSQRKTPRSITRGATLHRVERGLEYANINILILTDTTDSSLCIVGFGRLGSTKQGVS